MARVLVLAPFSILPATAGNKARILALARSLRGLGHDVHFARIGYAGKLPSDWPLHQAEFGEANAHCLFPEPAEFARVASWLKKALYSLARRASSVWNRADFPYNFLDERLPSGYGRPLMRLCEAQNFSVVIVEYVYISALLRFVPKGATRVIDSHDLFTDRHKAMKTASGQYTFYSLKGSAEAKGLSRADVVLAIEPGEADRMRKELKVPSEILTVGHLVDVCASLTKGEGARASFLGSDTLGNLDSMKFFISEILPDILCSLPDFKLVVGGSICRRLEPVPGIELRGELQDVRTLFREAPILLNPARKGTGMAIKLLEALGNGVPVITTATGARGHHPDRGGMIIVPDDAVQDFSAATVRVIQDPSSWKRLSGEAIQEAIAWNHTQMASLARAINP